MAAAAGVVWELYTVNQPSRVVRRGRENKEVVRAAAPGAGSVIFDVVNEFDQFHRRDSVPSRHTSSPFRSIRP